MLTKTGSFARDGYVGPFRAFSVADCREIAAYLRRDGHPAPDSWGKGRAVHERYLYDLAVRPALLSRVKALLGEDVVLWGVSAVVRGPGAIHPWHSDIESSAPDGRFVTAWIGIEHTSRESALQVISHSHLLGKTVQEARLERGLSRDQATPDAMVAAARAQEVEAELIQPDMANGEAILFDGRLWHGSDNSRKAGNRLALLFQYAAASCPVRIPDLTQLDWPFRLKTTPWPAAILVSGTDGRGINRIVPPPPPVSEGQPMVVTAIHPIVLPIDQPRKDWEAFPAFRGPTRTFADMACHASVLTGGHTPHPPHAHPEEELLIPLHGEVELRITAGPDDPAPRIERIRPGSFVFYPAHQHHTIRNPGATGVGYLMFKWRAGASGAETVLGTGIHQYGDLAAPAGAAPFWTKVLFEGATTCLGKLHAHLTVLQPGAGYAPHVDAYDVAIVVLAGQVETLGETVGANSVIYCSAGEAHGMRNPGGVAARYLVFEFHAPGIEARAAGPGKGSLVRRVGRFGKRVARGVWRRVLHGRR